MHWKTVAMQGLSVDFDFFVSKNVEISKYIQENVGLRKAD